MVVRQPNVKQRTETGSEAGTGQACVCVVFHREPGRLDIPAHRSSNAILCLGGRRRNQYGHQAPIHNNAEAIGGIAERMNDPLHAVEVRLNG